MILSSTTLADLNAQINQKLLEGKFLWGSPVIVPADMFNPVRFYQAITDTSPGDGDPGKSAYQIWLEQPGNAGKSIDDFFASISGVRRKSEVYWTGLSNVLTDNVAVNLITMLKATPQTTGTLTPFFNTTDNKMHCINENTTMTFKLNISGVFAGNAAARSLEIAFVNTQLNTLVQNRVQGIPAGTASNFSFPTFFSVDKDGNLATNGTVINIKPNGGDFTVQSVLLVAEQVEKNI